jgi:hypothetical protein
LLFFYRLKLALHISFLVTPTLVGILVVYSFIFAFLLPAEAGVTVRFLDKFFCNADFSRYQKSLKLPAVAGVTVF